MKLTKRKGFNFFRSYYDVYNELNDKDKIAFMDALLDRQFLGIKPDGLTGMAKFAYISQTNSIDGQVKGYNDKMEALGEPLLGSDITPTVPPTDGGIEPPCQQEEGKGEVKEEEQVQLFPWPTFEDFWNLYDLKVNKPKCEIKFKKISQGAREKIMEHLQEYIPNTPDKKFRKNPLTYLNNESWNDEIIKHNGTTKQQSNTNSLIEGFAKRVMQRNSEQ